MKVNIINETDFDFSLSILWDGGQSSQTDLQPNAEQSLDTSTLNIPDGASYRVQVNAQGLTVCSSPDFTFHQNAADVSYVLNGVQPLAARLLPYPYGSN